MLDRHRGMADVRLWLARPVDPLDSDRLGIGLQHRVDVRARGRSPDYRALAAAIETARQLGMGTLRPADLITTSQPNARLLIWRNAP